MRVEVSEKSGQIHVFAQKQVVDEVVDSSNEISLEEARGWIPITLSANRRDRGDAEGLRPDRGSTAKQVVIQRIREAERALVYKSTQIAKATSSPASCSDPTTEVLVDLASRGDPPPKRADAQGELHPRHPAQGVHQRGATDDQRPAGRSSQEAIPACSSASSSSKCPRSTTGSSRFGRWLVRPAIAPRSPVSPETPTSIQSAPASAPGNPRSDGRAGAQGREDRHRRVSADAQRFVANALSPSRVVRVYTNETEKTARAVVPDHQLSLAIGREDKTLAWPHGSPAGRSISRARRRWRSSPPRSAADARGPLVRAGRPRRSAPDPVDFGRNPEEAVEEIDERRTYPSSGGRGPASCSGRDQGSTPRIRSSWRMLRSKEEERVEAPRQLRRGRGAA